MKHRLTWGIAFSFILGLLITIFWQELIRELILVPLTYLIWLGRLIYRSFDQQALWTSLLILVITLAWLSLRLKPGVSKGHVDAETDFPQRVLLWRRRLDEADRGTYMKWRLAQHLSELVVDALIYRTGQTRQQIDQELDMNFADLPDELVRYMRAARGFETNATMSRRLFSPRVPQPLDLPPETILRFLEEYLGTAD